MLNLNKNTTRSLLFTAPDDNLYDVMLTNITFDKVAGVDKARRQINQTFAPVGIRILTVRGAINSQIYFYQISMLN